MKFNLIELIFLFTKLDLFEFSFALTDLEFPIDLSNVAKDHPFLENDPLQSLYRRLVALNRCATMRLDSAHKHGTNVSIFCFVLFFLFNILYVENSQAKIYFAKRWNFLC